MTNKICIYTCITGNYDNLKEIENKESGIEYFCFTNNKNLKSKTWTVVYVDNDGLDDHRLSRKIKMLGHPKIDAFDISVWIDASVVFDISIKKFVRKFLGNENFAAFKHSARKSVFDEAKECIFVGKDTADEVKRTVDFLKKENFPDNVGLHEMTVFIKRHNNPAVKRAMEEWFVLNKKYSKRDQLTFDYVIWKQDLKINTIDLNVWSNEYFHCLPHLISQCPKFAVVSFGDFNKETKLEDLFTYNYKKECSVFSTTITVSKNTKMLYINLSNIAGLFVENLEFSSKKITKIEKPITLKYSGGEILIFSHCPFILFGDFRQGDMIDLSFVSEELYYSQIMSIIQDLYSKNHKLQSDYNRLLDEHNNIINSKSWKSIRKIRSLFPPY